MIPSRRGPALSREVRERVNPEAIIFTDDWQAYKPLAPRVPGPSGDQPLRRRLRRGRRHTNTIEGFFGNLKTGMRGAYKHVSRKWLQSYLDEYAWRHNAKRKGRRCSVSYLLARHLTGVKAIVKN